MCNLQIAERTNAPQWSIKDCLRWEECSGHKRRETKFEITNLRKDNNYDINDHPEEQEKYQTVIHFINPLCNNMLILIYQKDLAMVRWLT